MTFWSRKSLPSTKKGVLGKQLETRRRRLGRQAERRGAGAAALHLREQGGDDHRRPLRARSRWLSTSWRSAKRCCFSSATSVPTTLPARTACATASARISSGRPRPAAIAPVLVKAFGQGKKVAYMTPDYTYGHTVTRVAEGQLTAADGWTMVTNQVSPLGTPDFSHTCPTSPIRAPSSWSTSTGATTRSCRSSRPSNSACRRR